ncbi:C2 domain-containing protein 5-like [Teleopsis dalmanni]|uniref:C2 domain-containing protein 5-like n=1 Tax=Teleopsis dalmanni TaxID=139649 RepID=UPI0018CDF55C|nr:C2 domain-containing protein 5-like [Teleopsis dalmanni]
MPGKVGVKIKAGRNLPIMDRSSDTTDAYVEIKLGTITQKTDVCRKSLNPHWNTDWFRFEVDDAELQDEPLQIRLMDHDTYSANDAIGKVNISLNPLCLETSGQTTQGKGTVFSGWIPVFDTMHGIRGEVNIIVKVDLFSDLNKFRQSSCGIPFYHSQCIPHGYRAQIIHGFVEELVVNDDPEYQWIDKIRTPRASNEARQVVFLKLSGQVQRKMGLKAINMGANAVIGYTQCFDLEGDVGVVARGIGTAVTLIKDTNIQPNTADNALIEESTQKYLEFLTGGNINLCGSVDWDIKIDKSSSITFLNLPHSISDTDLTTMQELIRQEDERGEKSAKKLKHHMKRLTRSSRNILNEKCNSLMRKIGDGNESKSVQSSSSLSLSSLFTGGFMKDDLGASARSSLLTVRKSSFKAKSKATTLKPVQRQSLKSTHPIVRSVSDDSAMQHGLTCNKHTTAPKVAVITEFTDNTRSSPNICGEEQLILRQAILAKAEESKHQPFGEFTAHAPHLKTIGNETKCGLMSSSTTLSESDTESSSSDEYSVLAEESTQELQLNSPAEDCDEKFNFRNLNLKYKEKSKPLVESLHLQQRNDSINHDQFSNTKSSTKPSKSSGSEKDKTHAIKQLQLFKEFKAFSHNLQELLHKTSKLKRRNKHQSINSALASAKLEPSSITSKPCVVKSPEIDAHKSYYSSQPEISTDFDSTIDLAKMKKLQTCSLNNLSYLATMPQNVQNVQNANKDSKCKANQTLLSNVNDIVSPTKSTYPILQICPSTPTPSESDNSQLSPTDLKCNDVQKSFSLHALSSASFDLLDFGKKLSPRKVPQNACKLSKHISNLTPNDHYLNTNTTNHSNKYSPLLASSTLPLCIKHPHHRSLSEISSTTGITASTTDSPNLKRTAPPTLDSRTKLSTSPTKSGVNVASQSDSISSTTTSTATTMIPRDVGEICRRSSDSDLSITPKGNSICVASERLVAATAMMRLSQPITSKSSNADTVDMLEYPFLTMTKYPTGFILHIGATVAARSVKLLERVPNLDEPEIRDSWWTELRMEVRSHARALCCNVVLGYSESTTISDDVCVLSATGTAAVINMAYNRSVSQTDIFAVTKTTMSASLEERDTQRSDSKDSGTNEISHKDSVSSSLGTTQSSNNNSAGKKYGLPGLNISKNSCTMCHVPYNLGSVPFNVKMKKCAICRKGRVPDVLLSTLEVPEYLQVTGRGCFIQAQVVRAKKDLRSELNAKEISDGLPFLEYELHRVLINKLKAKGMNAIFGLKAQVSIGERMIALIATGTALFLSALPIPQVPKIVAGNSWTDKQKLNELQKKLQETFERNQEIYQLKSMDPDLTAGTLNNLPDKQSDTDESDDEVIEIDLNCGNKDTCVLEVDDIEDLEIISLLMEPYPPEGFHVVNTQSVPGMVDMEAVKNLQMFTQVWRAKLDVGQYINGFPKQFQRLLQTIYFKLRTMIPCAICDLRFRLDLPESVLALSPLHSFKLLMTSRD